MELEAIYRAPRSVFRELLDQTAAELESATYVEEWLGPKQRLPVFDVQVLRDFLGLSSHRDRLAALLASYVRVQSGSVWERRAGRWRRRRYSELNPVDLAELGAFVVRRVYASAWAAALFCLDPMDEQMFLFTGEGREERPAPSDGTGADAGCGAVRGPGLNVGSAGRRAS